MLTICALSGGATYALRHLSSNDYYSENEKVIGHWMGRGAGLLHLEGEVRMEQFDAVRQGLDPVTQAFLRPRQSADRFNEEGERTGTARSLYDFTVSAPKSVSIQALVDPRLREAHLEAVREMAAEMESLASARVRQKGADEDRITGNLILAAYHHDTSRELDPQLHSHLVGANLTYDGVEGRWKALQASAVYEGRGYLTEVYRNALARSVREYGYEIVDRFHNGRERGFEIRGVSEETLDTFSQRSEQRDQAIAQFTVANGRGPTNREVAVLVRDSRNEKLTEISTAAVRAHQWERLGPARRAELENLRHAAQERGPSVEQGDAAASLAHAREHLFERVSVAQDFDLKREALWHGRGRIALPDLKAAAVREEARGLVWKVGTEVATKESLARERRMVDAVNRGQGQYGRLGGSQEFIASDRLRPEQKRAVEVVLDSRDLAVNLRGAAGTGKTATLQEIRRGVTEGGRQIAAVAPTRSAVEELVQVGYGDAFTIERLLQDPREQGKLRGKVLVVDEAGMVSSRQMSELLAVAEREKAQLVFSGDTRQIQSVEAGDALRVLERESRLRSVSLSQVQRQTLTEYRDAVEALRENPERGFRRFEAMGAVREVDAALRPQEVSRAYREVAAQPNAQGLPRQVLVVAPTHEEIRRLTVAIRQDREQSGELGASQELTRHIPLHWTGAQKKDLRRFQPGMMLEFHKGTKIAGKNEAVEVVRVEKDKVIARKESGLEVALTGRQAKAFSVYERQTIPVAPGDRLLLEANRRELKFRATNGELVTVRGVEGGRIQLEDGRTLPHNYRQFDHGYAVTVHRSQGKTVDAVIVSGDRMAQELFYVAVSRGRESLTVVTSDKAELERSVGVSAERQSATELARKAEGAKQGHRLPRLTIGEHLESARNWVLHLAVAYGFRKASKTPEHTLVQPAAAHQRPLPKSLEVHTREMQIERQPKPKERAIDRGHGFGR